MDLLSAFKRKTPPAAAPVEAADGVQRARTRARQRLIGAAVLVVVGIIGFPLLFETQPRPIPVDLPIEIPRKEGVPPLAMPAPAPAPEAKTPTRPPPAPEGVITETEAEAGREVAASAAPGASAPPAPRPAAAPAQAQAPRAAAPSADAARAQALLEGKAVPGAASEAAAGAPRFVVQVGAFAEAGALRDVRARVEKLGLKTYTQVAQTADGPRTRVRVGPFATRGEAERAATKIKSAELPAAILTL